ncbi:MAG TPA: HTH domain-containing protein [Euryarchaeota archaeon]|nr:HTH domain-containing protein [Euryarchaeota archaeon]
MVDSEVRRKRIKKGLELLGNDPTVINVARLANTFGVSRTMIYKDLEYLGFKRS